MDYKSVQIAVIILVYVLDELMEKVLQFVIIIENTIKILDYVLHMDLIMTL